MQRFDPPQGGRQSPIPAFGPAGAANPSPWCDVPVEQHEWPCHADPGVLLEAMLAGLQTWARRLTLLHSEDAGSRPPLRLQGRIRCPATGPGSGQVVLFGRVALAEGLAALSPPLPKAWNAALLRGWPDLRRGLHRIELTPGSAWVSIEIGLARTAARRLEARQAGLRTARAPAARDAIVVGAGLAGCAMADALARRGWRATVIEASARTGGAVADIPLLAQHPALSPGADRRSRLLVAALLASRRLAGRFGAALTWCGRFQPMPLDEAGRRTGGMPPSVAQAVACSTREMHGVEGMPGIWFPDCAMADPQQWWRQVLQTSRVTLRLSQPVSAITRQAGRWQAIDEQGGVIASAAVMVLANQAGALELAEMPPLAAGRLRKSCIQVAVGTAEVDGAGSIDTIGTATGTGLPAARRPAILGGSSYRLEYPGRCCVIGPLRPGIDDLARHAIDLPPPTIGDEAYRWRLSHPGERLLLRDNLPMIGAAPDIVSIAAARADFERNDRLPLPRREALHLLTGLGGRGLLWSVIGAEMIAAAIDGEPPVVEPELEDAVDPARFLKRGLRRAATQEAAQRPDQADGTNVSSSWCLRSNLMKL